MKTIIAKNNWFVNSDLRLDASFHLSEGHLTLIAFKNASIKAKPLSQITEKIFYGNRSKRVYVNNPKKGLPFIKGADIIKANFSSLKYISKARTANLNDYFLEEGWTLITRSGTIGNTAYVNKDFIGKAASDDIIRIVPKNIPSGFLYAFLSSKHGQSLLKHGTYGAVIQHIEPEHIENIPIPIFPSKKQEKIHNLIVEAVDLRVEANQLLEEAIMTFENSMPQINRATQYIISVKSFGENNLRLDSTTNFSNIQSFYKQLEQTHELYTIEELSEQVFTPGIFKRIRVNNPKNGIPFLSGSDLLDSMPAFNSFLSKGMKNLKDYILYKGWIAIQDAGTIGYVTLINGYLDGVSATNNLVRIIPKQTKNNNPYIFTFLKTKQGQAILKSLEYGSVQKHIDNNQVSKIKIPILPLYQEIYSNVSSYLDMVTEACYKESEAIHLIEKEIDSWQQS